jgi:hypothetical protein
MLEEKRAVIVFYSKLPVCVIAAGIGFMSVSVSLTVLEDCQVGVYSFLTL